MIELDNLYGDGSFEDEWDIFSLKMQADLITSECLGGGVYNASRVSGRTGQEMALRGFVGKMLYSGDFTPFREVLRYLPLINVGRFNVFGCGWCKMCYLNN